MNDNDPLAVWIPNHNVLIGIIGGIGPAASVQLYQNVVNLRGSSCASSCRTDADHIPLIIYNNPQIPNNNAAVMGTGPPSLPALVYTAQALGRAGATHIAIPCNTAHVFAAELQRQIQPLSLIDMIKLTVQTVAKILRERSKEQAVAVVYKVGLMGTDGTRQSKVYDTAFQEDVGKFNGFSCSCF